jgi:diacylglycerol kinase (ATP)
MEFLLMARRALLISNPKSRNGQNPLDVVVDLLKASGFEMIHADTSCAEDISPAIVSCRDKIDCVLVAGGDGTLNAAAPGLVETGLPLGILPTGTANDLARTLSIPTDLALATRLIIKGNSKRIDVGTVNEHYFFNVASIGLSAAIAQSLTGEAKRRFGPLSYPIAALRALASTGRFSAEIISKDERVRVKTLQIAIGNGRFYGGGNAVEQDAAIDDGHLDLYSLEFQTVWKMALMLRSFRVGQHGLWQEVRTAKCKQFEIRTTRPRPINLDGELKTHTPAVFGLEPKAITVYVPGLLQQPASY